MKTKSDVGTNIVIFLIVAAILFIGLGVLITTNEEMPRNAKFSYNTKTQIIVPLPVDGCPVFYAVFENRENKWDGVADWSEIGDPNGRFATYHLPKGLGWDSFKFYGESVPLWETLLHHRYQSRWDENGKWRY